MIGVESTSVNMETKEWYWFLSECTCLERIGEFGNNEKLLVPM